MRIILNNREENFDGEIMSVSEMLDIKRFTFRMRIIKLNGVLVPKDAYETTFIRNGDNVQMLYLMSGG
jgi:thiamine biosynthesis protein ThiS